MKMKYIATHGGNGETVVSYGNYNEHILESLADTKFAVKEWLEENKDQFTKKDVSPIRDYKLVEVKTG